MTLVIGNILTNRLIPSALYVPTNLLTASAVFFIARRLVTSHDMGLAKWSTGARWGGIVVAVGFACYVIALVTPGLQDLFHDRRVDGGIAVVLYHVFIRIPFGTVVLEELAFRAALPAVFARYMSTFRAVTLSSVLFGLWHVFPSLNLSDVNPVFEGVLGDGVAGKAIGVGFAVVGTFFVGLWMSFLRYRSGSVLAPMIAHIGSNSGAYVLSWIFGGGVIETSIMRV